MIKIIIPLALILTGSILLIYIKTHPHNTTSIKEVSINNTKISVEVANTPIKLAKGLMFRKSLDKNSGMLFVFDTSSKHGFWMLNTYIPLDIIWINENKEIVHIEENLTTCDKAENIKEKCRIYKPDSPAKYVLEINAGKSSAWNINLGDKVSFHY